METSFLIAKILGIVYLAIGLAFVFNHKYYHKLYLKLLKNTEAMFWGGICALVFGVLLTTYHNIWEASWVVVISVFGWLALLKGVFLLFFPKWFTDFVKGFAKKKGFIRFMAFVCIVLGLFFSYYGFESFLSSLVA